MQQIIADHSQGQRPQDRRLHAEEGAVPEDGGERVVEDWNGLVSVTVSASPEKIESMPRVTRKEGMRALVTSRPETAPISAPMATTARGATNVGAPRS